MLNELSEQNWQVWCINILYSFDNNIAAKLVDTLFNMSSDVRKTKYFDELVELRKILFDNA